MTPEQMKKRYEKRIKTYLKKIQKIFREAGFVAAIDLIDCDDEYSWRLSIDTPKREKDGGVNQADLSFYITEERAREGSGEGYSFMVTLHDNEGCRMGAVAPANYTDGLWLTDPTELDERFNEVLETTPSEWYSIYFVNRSEAEAERTGKASQFAVKA